MKEQTIILSAAVMTLLLIGSILSIAPAAYAKTSHHSSNGNSTAPSNQSSNTSALSLTNPGLNNLQPPSGGQQNNTNPQPQGMSNLAPGGGQQNNTNPQPQGMSNLAPGGGQQNNTNPTNQETIKTLPGLKQLNPGGQNNTSGTPTNTTIGPVRIKLPPGVFNPGNLTNAPPGTAPGNNTGTPPNNSTGTAPGNNTGTTNGNNNTNANKNNNTNINTNTNTNTNKNTNTNVNTNTNTNTILNTNTIQNTVKINNVINNVIRSASQTSAAATTITSISPTSKGPLVDLETLRLGKSIFPSGGIRPLADVAPFRIIGGHVSLNSPSPNVYVIVAQITDNGVQHAVIVDLKKTASGIPGETLYHTDLGQTITGTNPFTGKGDTISTITDLLLYNNNKTTVQFNDDSELTMTIIYK